MSIVRDRLWSFHVVSTVVALGLATSSGCGSKETPESTDTKRPSASAEHAGPVDPKEIPVPEVLTGNVSIYTASGGNSEPGFTVFIDGEPVRDAKFDLLTTPCEVAAPRGEHVFIVAKDGFRQETRTFEVRGGDNNQILFQVVELEPETKEEGIFQSAYFNAPVAEPIALSALNTDSRELDPFVTPDGRSIWFVSDRPEGRGVWVATRPGVFDAFGEPKYVPVTRSPDQIGSPSVTADGLLLFFTTPEKGRISATERASVESDFGAPKAVQFSHADAFWPTAQVSSNGTSLYWTEAEASGKPTRTMHAARKRRDEKFAQTAPFVLPGGMPCLSADGLRQYVFDGKILERARRTTPSEPFSRTEVRANIDLKNYVPSKERRQFWVSEDEQWLYYSDNPDAAGDLYLVRLFPGRGWGIALQGKSIAPLVAEKPKTVEPEPTETTTPAAPPPTDKPQSYSQHWSKFQELMAGRKYKEAAALVSEGQANPALAADQKILAWDAEDVRHAQAFWDDARTALAGLKAGQAVRLGAVKVDFVRFENDTLHAKLKSKEIEKKMQEIAPGDLATLLDEAFGKDKPETQMRIGTFLYYDPQGNDRTAAARLERAGPQGEEFLERIPARLMHRAWADAKRDSAGAGLLLAEEVLKNYASSRASEDAKKFKSDVYRLIEWNPIGSRQWQKGDDGEYAAAPGKSRGAGLQSPREYENFELRLEWKTQGALGQGGVFFHWSGEELPSTANAFKLHLANDFGAPPDLFSTGALFKLEAAKENAVLAEGKWNTLILRVQGQKVTAVINGKKVLETTASSKDVGTSGYAVLDGEVGGITYRRTLLVELPK